MLAACPSQPADAPPKPAKSDAEAKQAAIDAERTRTEVAKAKAAKDTATVDIKGGDTASPAGATPAAGDRRYPPGTLPPAGMTPEEIKAFAVAVGDPTGGEFTLAQAFEGDPALADKAGGRLVAAFDTTMGAFECVLYEDEAPLTVANFVGLARGLRPTWDKKTNAWVTKKYYDGNIFHRVMKGFMVQTGEGTARGNPGYVIVDEFAKGLRHDAAGVLSMANQEKPNTGNTQFFITVRDTKHLDGKHAVFGKCSDAKVPIEISKVKVDARANHRPYEQVKINTITIARKKK